MLTKPALATSTKQLGSCAEENLPNVQNAKLVGPEVEFCFTLQRRTLRTAASDR